MNIAELKKNVGVEGIEVAGIVKKIYPIKKGEGEWGPWSYQSMTIEDNSDSITVSLGNHESIKPEFEGLPVLFQPSLDKDGKKIGVSIKEESYKDKNGKQKTSIKVIANAAAKIVWGGEPKNTPSLTPSSVQGLVDDKMRSMLISYVKDLVISGMYNGYYPDEVSAATGFTHWLNLLTAPKEEKKVEAEVNGSDCVPF